MPPLAGVRAVEFEALGPVPYAGMMLADLGADIVRRDRGPEPARATDRGRRIVAVDVRQPDGRAAALSLAERADVVSEGFRPGVLERLELAPALLLERNPALVIGRMTAWGQEGEMSRFAGHDLNVIALTGVLGAIGPAGRPAIALNLIADYGGGALHLVVAMPAALMQVRAGGPGQILDCAMCDGTAALATLAMSMPSDGRAVAPREANPLDGGAPFYAVCRCADGGFMAVAAVEPPFYARLLAALSLEHDAEFIEQHDRALWPARRARLQAVFAVRPRDYWEERFRPIDACVTPVLDFAEAVRHPQLVGRGVFGPTACPRPRRESLVAQAGVPRTRRRRPGCWRSGRVSEPDPLANLNPDSRGACGNQDRPLDRWTWNGASPRSASQEVESWARG